MGLWVREHCSGPNSQGWLTGPEDVVAIRKGIITPSPIFFSCLGTTWRSS